MKHMLCEEESLSLVQVDLNLSIMMNTEKLSCQPRLGWNNNKTGSFNISRNAQIYAMEILMIEHLSVKSITAGVGANMNERRTLTEI